MVVGSTKTSPEKPSRGRLHWEPKAQLMVKNRQEREKEREKKDRLSTASKLIASRQGKLRGLVGRD